MASYLIGTCIPFFGKSLSSKYLKLSPSVRSYAARKGTRERMRKKKVKVEVKKIGFIPHNQRSMNQPMVVKSKRVDDSWKRQPVDNVWCQTFFQWRVYDFSEAVECHRETHHPTMYNQPEALLKVKIDLDMRLEKKNRYLDNLSRIAAIPYPFSHEEERSVLVFTKQKELQEEAAKAGATLVGGVELIKDVQDGNLSLQDFQFIISHPNILTELVSIRGLMKKKFPNTKIGTLGPNISELVQKFITGIHYTATKDEHEQSYALVEAVIGRLNMDVKHLEANLKAVFDDLSTVRPKKQAPFITRCVLVSDPSNERLKINHEMYTKEQEEDRENVEDDDVEKNVVKN